ncbi:hypothetical protein P3521_19795 [Vibrio parahaemolyticus]|uniref:hypothetical protein n=1 Tax=Vibrio parahaemolyticus TaxID=670 RepID=UPI000A3C139A|nr:hypothetical protein [Vibrio parahaemolyticus]QLK49733.1 hypothetical protein DR996_32645 [Vibrio owensii]MBE3793595.1 hypothetical protein [Vibrio parahaemolyticus]MBE3866456.1 hypothetical protein [Vibrio parahaemolyticus]MCZ5880797.1 hypothetical protein [Vibrio parahaemolyticus]MDF4424285.1 hypothetical protein [Vibrio parahaemolyticus]
MINLPQTLINKIIKPTFEKNARRVQRRYVSKLDFCRYEILTLYNELNCSLGDIQRWLKMKHNIEISKTAIHNRVIHWNKIIERGPRSDKEKQAKK